MTFNVFEAINEVQEILNALDENIPDALRDKAFKGEVTPADYERLSDKYSEKFPASKIMYDFTSSSHPYHKAIVAKTSAPAQVKSIERKVKEGNPELLKSKDYEKLKAVAKSLEESVMGLREEFSDLFEDRVRIKPGTNSLTKAITKKLKYGAINLDKALDLDKKIEDNLSIHKQIHDLVRDNKLGTDSKALGKAIRRHDKKNSLKEQLEELRESFPSIFEGSQKEVNKIKKEKKNDKNEPVEVVSVADELFPREGNAKQQYNQKVLDIINGMIEGTNTLEDLIQFVRKQKVQGMKESFDLFEEKLYNEIENLTLLEEVINELKDSTLKSAADKAEQIADAQEESEPNAKDKEWVKTEASRRRHQSGKMKDYYENQVIKREKEKYEKSKEGNKSKEN